MKLQNSLNDCAVGEAVSISEMFEQRECDPHLFSESHPNCNGIDDMTYAVDSDSEPLISRYTKIQVKNGSEFAWARVA